MPTTNSTGIQDAALFHELTTGAWAVVDFFMMLFDTARNWGDTELTAMPSYRDRVVHVALADDEGGLNLSMPGAARQLARALEDLRSAPQPHLLRKAISSRSLRSPGIARGKPVRRGRSRACA
jgi:hypothetical protein